MALQLAIEDTNELSIAKNKEADYVRVMHGTISNTLGKSIFTL